MDVVTRDQGIAAKREIATAVRCCSPGMNDKVHKLLVRLRWMSLVDAVSYVLLVGVAMPLKYAAGMPKAVTVVGMIHGLVWMLLMWLLMRTRFETSWPSRRLWILGVAALLPIVPFFLDAHVRRWIERTGSPR